jgi:hypothetical protein
MRKMPHRSEHLKSTTRHGSVSGAAVGDRNDPVPLTPNAFRSADALTRRLPPPLQTQA